MTRRISTEVRVPNRPDGGVVIKRDERVPVSVVQRRLGSLLAGLGPAPVGREPFFNSMWTSRTATLFLFQDSDDITKRVVVKVLSSAHEAESLARSLNETADRLGDVVGTEKVRCLGLFDEPHAVVMNMVSGASLNQLLAGKPSDLGEICLYSRTAGEMLATYHSSTRGHPDVMKAAARKHLESIAVTARVPGSLNTLQHLLGTGDVVENCQDHFPEHLIVTSNGKLARIDSPVDQPFVYREHDLAAFMVRAGFAVYRLGQLARPFAAVKSMTVVRSAFISGYYGVLGRQADEVELARLEVWEALLLRWRLELRVARSRLKLRPYASPEFLGWRVRSAWQMKQIRKQRGAAHIVTSQPT